MKPVRQVLTLSVRLVMSAIVCLIVSQGLLLHAQVSTPTFVQVNSAVPQSTSVASVPVSFAAAQTAGDLNVVAVGWNDTTATTITVTDTAGNVYTRAIGPTFGNGLSQSIYYAKNIVAAAAGNKVTVTFSPAVPYPDVRILEYKGIDPTAPYDTSVAGIGSSTTSNSGIAVTNNANDLLFAANMVSSTTTGAGTGFTSRIITNPDGDIAEDRVVTNAGSYSATANMSSGAWVMQMVAFRAAGSPPPGPDTTPPTATITAPAQNASVIGFVTVSANASDNVGLAGVQFKVDGTNIGSELTTGPFTINWDSSTVTPGTTHTLTAVARDTSGNLGTSAGVTVTVQSAATLGQWSQPSGMPFVAVHSMLMPNGKLLFVDGQSLGLTAFVWDPVANSFTQKNPPDNLFCAGHTILPDGRVLVVGGHVNAHVGIKGAFVFNPSTQTWTTEASMANPRWYPTSTVLPDGRVIVTSGESNCDGCYVAQHEIYNPTSNSWSTLPGTDMSFAYYPHQFILPDGRFLVSSTTEAPIISRVLDLNSKTWTAIGSTALDGGSAVMYRPGKILKSGTSVNPDLAVRQSSANAYVLDMNQPTPAWRQVASMAFPRTYHTMTLLPDGKVFISGGGPNTDAVGTSNAILSGEIWNPDTETFTTVGSMVTPRLYHSTALLLADGRVAVMGGGRFNGTSEPTDQPSVEFYLPPYFFKGARPTISSAPTSLQYSQTFFVQTPDAAQIASVVLMRIGSVTHSFNMSQNYVPLTFQVASGGLNVTAPANSNLAVPGPYFLFIVNTNGVPSIAASTSLPVPAVVVQPPNAPTNLVANGGLGNASLSWSAASGPNGVAGYNVYRQASPNVAVTLANRIAQPTGTTYLDSSMPTSGTYYYVVTARDSAGNESTASNEAVATVTADVNPPSDPTNLAATSVSNSQINLTWTASTDDVGVSGYRIERCSGAGCINFTQVAISTTASFGDSGLAASTSYSYQVRASDAAGNLSNYSNVASATTAAAPPQITTPTFVQVNSAVPQNSAVASVVVPFNSAQTAGDLNVVIVGWNDNTASVASIRDTAGNVYVRAAGPTLGAGLTQSIYYAKNIVSSAAKANSVTVTFSPAAAYPDVRILEYKGIDSTTPVDVTGAAIGNNSTSSTGAFVTANPNDLIVAGNMVATTTKSAGTGFTSRVITKPDSDIAEDRVVSSAGSYTATAGLGSSGPWVMQAVAFRAAGSAPAAARMVEGGAELPAPQE